MATRDEKKAKPTGNGAGKSRMKVFVAGFEMEGNDDVMAEGFKAIRELSTAISRNTVLPPLVTKPALGAAPKPENAASGATTVEAVETAEPVEEVNDIQEEVSEEQEEETSNGNGGPKRTYKFKAPTFLHDLDLTKASKLVADYVAEKGNPTDILDKYLVVAVWFKDHMKIEDFTINHIYTAFDNLGWKADMPDNHSQPLRDLSKKHFLTKTKTGYQVGWQGTQYVEKMK
jgi:hypothetical protein